MPIRVTCPGCLTVVNAPDASAGKNIRCPKCGEIFRSVAAEGGQPVTARPGGVDALPLPVLAPVPPKPSEPPVLELADRRPPPRPRRPVVADEPAPKTPTTLIVGGVLGALFLVVGVGGVILYLIYAAGGFDRTIVQATTMAPVTAWRPPQPVQTRPVPPFPTPGGQPPEVGEPLVLPPVKPLPIQAAPLKRDKVTVPLPSAIAEVVVGGGGRFLILYLPKDRQLAVFDANEAKISNTCRLPARTPRSPPAWTNSSSPCPRPTSSNAGT